MAANQIKLLYWLAFNMYREPLGQQSHCIDEILLPYVAKTRIELSLPPHQSCLVIFDNYKFKAQCTSAVLQVLEDNNTLMTANCTDRLQPLDIAVNKSVKGFFRVEFYNWYSKQVCKQLEESKIIYNQLTFALQLWSHWVQLGLRITYNSIQGLLLMVFGKLECCKELCRYKHKMTINAVCC